MKHAHEPYGTAWTKVDEQDMREASARNAHVAFVDAFRINSRGLHNADRKGNLERDWAGAFGFNPHLGKKQGGGRMKKPRGGYE